MTKKCHQVLKYHINKEKKYNVGWLETSKKGCLSFQNKNGHLKILITSVNSHFKKGFLTKSVKYSTVILSVLLNITNETMKVTDFLANASRVIMWRILSSI